MKGELVLGFCLAVVCIFSAYQDDKHREKVSVLETEKKVLQANVDFLNHELEVCSTEAVTMTTLYEECYAESQTLKQYQNEAIIGSEEAQSGAGNGSSECSGKGCL